MQIGLNLNQFQGNQGFAGGVSAGQGAQQPGQQPSGSQNDLKSLGLDPATAANGMQQAQKFFGGANLQ